VKKESIHIRHRQVDCVALFLVQVHGVAFAEEALRGVGVESGGEGKGTYGDTERAFKIEALFPEDRDDFVGNVPINFP
jgi:hypothetical protein